MVSLKKKKKKGLLKLNHLATVVFIKRYSNRSRLLETADVQQQRGVWD